MASDIKTTIGRSLAGKFLVATPYLQDAPYRRSVVLVMRHDEHGALGFVMDNQLRTNLRVLEDFFRKPEVRDGAAGEFPGLRMFTGVVIWPAGKLEQELEQGVWMHTPARLEVAMRYDDLWADLVRKIGRDVLREGLGIHQFPQDPSLN